MEPPRGHPPAYRFRAGRRRGLLLVCDHASNRMPPELGDLGLSEAERGLHIAWDPGAAGVTEALAARLDCPAFFGTWSRLVVDLNRPTDAGDLIVCENDGVTVHGNVTVADAERARRLRAYHHPYHEAITAYLDALAHEGVQPALVAIHSFTPSLHGLARPWPVGVLWKERQPWHEALIAYFAAQGLEVGDNQPYDGRAALGYTIDRHGLQRGLRQAMIELRQDLLVAPAEQARWAEMLELGLVAAGMDGGG